MNGIAPRRVPSFGEVVASHHGRGELVVQPRMGFVDPNLIREGLLATRDARAFTVGTITLDSYPLVDQDPATTMAMLDGVITPQFPVQVRHGSADARRVVRALLACGLSATEGGPVSYCLPYSRMPLASAVDNWRQCCETLAAARSADVEPHLETFGGGVMGQLCPPALLVALSVLEGMFFWQHGVRCISFSYAQQTNAAQDEEAVAALRALIPAYVPPARTHVVIYTYVGLYPRTPRGAMRLLASSARLAARSGASRLIVKTVAEAHRRPTVTENVAALEHAAAAARGVSPGHVVQDTGIYAQAKALVDNTVALDRDLGRALLAAFAAGYLDVPFCQHPDNAGRTRGYLDRNGELHWHRIGSLPIGELVELPRADDVNPAGLLGALKFVERTFDQPVESGELALDSTHERGSLVADHGGPT